MTFGVSRPGMAKTGISIGSPFTYTRTYPRSGPGVALGAKPAKSMVADWSKTITPSGSMVTYCGAQVAPGAHGGGPSTASAAYTLAATAKASATIDRMIPPWE